MSRTDRRSFLVSSVALLSASIRALPLSPQKLRVTLTPEILAPGSPVLIQLRTSEATAIEGEWLTRKLAFFRTSPGNWAALAGLDVESSPGPSTLHITVHNPAGPEDLSRPVDVLPAHYRSGKLTVAPKFVSPDPEELKQIEADRALKDKVFASSAPQRLWSGNFHAPVAAPPTDSFGTRRTFNGKLASIHKGMDFRTPTGTPIHAANSGTVVLACRLYYEGNCIAIDHGLGLYSISMHLSRINVKEGDRVHSGQPLGLSGATGRVTGPHLHWAIRWQSAYLDPAKLLKLDLSLSR